MESPYMDLENSNIQSQQLCNRCKVKQGEYFCNECSPFNIFCSNCDTFIHSLPSKRNHQRELIPQKIIYNETNQNESTLPFSNRSIQSNLNSNSQFISQNPIYVYENNLKNKNDSKTYINDIKNIYEGEKEELYNKNFILQKQLNDTQKKYESQILDLKNSINEIKAKNEMEIKNIIKNHETELKRIVNEKDNQINYLYNHNFELEKANDELVTKVNQYSDLMNKNKFGFGDKMNNYENTIYSLQRDNDNMKDFYEKKINFFSQNFSTEKNKIINSYEDTLEQLNNNYNDSKEKYNNIIKQRDDEIKDLIKQHRNETDKLIFTISELQKQLEEMRQDQENLMKINSQQKIEIDSLNENLEMAKKEIKFHMKEKRKIQENSDNFKKEFNKVKAENEKMRRLSYGKFQRSKTSINK
jgi:chromosome segregation ATPase